MALKKHYSSFKSMIVRECAFIFSRGKRTDNKKNKNKKTFCMRLYFIVTINLL